jgi:hypothetical protein
MVRINKVKIAVRTNKGKGINGTNQAFILILFAYCPIYKIIKGFHCPKTRY